MLDFDDYELGRLERSEPDHDIHDAGADVNLGRGPSFRPGKII